MTLNTSRRHVIATVGPDKYLVSLSVTTSVDQVVAAADATDAIVNGFKVSVPASPTPAPSPPAPGLPQSPSQLGAQGAQPALSRNFWDCRDSRRPPGEAWRPGDGPIRRTVSEARIVWRMLIAAVLCLCAAVATAGLGLWLLTRPVAADPVRQVLRAVAPTQLAAAVMLAAGGVVALSARAADRPARCGGVRRSARWARSRPGAGRAPRWSRRSARRPPAGPPACEGTVAGPARPARCPVTELACSNRTGTVCPLTPSCWRCWRSWRWRRCSRPPARAADVLVGSHQGRDRAAVLALRRELSPTEALHGLRHWRLHLLVLAATFVAFPLLGLAARALVPSVLTPDLYTGVLFLCLVPSTVQSSIAFTSIAHGNVPAAIVSASLSNILGVVLTPLLVVLLMHTTGGPAHRRVGRAWTSWCSCCCRSSPANCCGRGWRRGCTGMRWSQRRSTAARSCSSSTPRSR